MSRQYFGTDGIRGRANTHPMTADMAQKVAMATAVLFKERLKDGQTERVVIGKDTRLSCYMFEQALTSGFLAMGMDVILTGPIPTPGVAMLTRALRADIGVMISASHNPFEDNGIKLFGADGFKLDDDLELEIETLIDSDLSNEMAAPDKLGKAARFDDALGRYAEFVKSSLPRGESLSGLKVVVDCAHGAAYKIAPQVLWELEAEVIAIHNAPNGKNINAACGATAPDKLQAHVLAEGADIGIALDGDADRIIVVDEKGQVVDGDQLMAALALSLAEKGALAKKTLTTTVMSNLGLEKFLDRQGLKMIRTPVGDRYVVDAMRKKGYTLGGEQSGHIVLADYGTTGDGLLAALQILRIVKEKGVPASECLNLFQPMPQILKNVRFEDGKAPLEDKDIKAAIAKAEKTLANDGRLLIRKSGTEPVIRVMAEGSDPGQIESVVDGLCEIIEKHSVSS